MGRQNLSGQKYLFLAWDSAKTISIHTHKNKTHRVARLTHDRKVADSNPPPPPRPTNHAQLHLGCVRIDLSQDDRKPLFHRLRLHSSSKECIEAPVCNNLSYALMLLRFCYDLFSILLFTFLEKIVPAPFFVTLLRHRVCIPSCCKIYPSTHTYQKGIQ